MCGASTKRVAQHRRDHTERSEEYARKAQNLLNPDGGRLKLGSLASTRCTGLVAKYTVGPLSLDTRWAVKRPSLITSKNTRRSHPQAVCSMHTLARSRLAVCSMQVAATHEGCLLPSTSPNSSSRFVVLDLLEHLPKPK